MRLRPRVLTRLPAGLFAALFLLLVAAPPRASAHAALKSSNPANGAVVDRAPGGVTLSFTEPPEVPLSSVEVVDPEGRTFHRGPLENAAGGPLTLRQSLASLPKGVYTVTWKVVSRADAHLTAGAFAFGVGVSPLEAPPVPTVEAPRTPSASSLEIGSRWLLLVGLVLLLGSTATALIAFGDAPAVVRRLSAGAWALSLAGLLGLALAQRRAAGVGIGTLIETTIGRALVWRAAAILLAGGALAAAWVAQGSGPRRVATAAAAAAAAGAILAESAGGHAAAAESFRWVSVGSQWAHIAAVGVWIGGLAALLLGVRGETDERKAGAVRRFSRLAGFALAVVVGSGAFRALAEVERVRALFTTPYGRGVVAKIGLVAVLAGLGAINRYRNVPRAGVSLTGLRRVSRVELSVAAVALAAAALLAGLAPPRSIVTTAAAAPRPGALRLSGSDFGTSVRVRLDVDPGFAGPNRFVVRVTDYDSGEPVEGADVTLRFSPRDGDAAAASAVDLEPRDVGTYETAGSGLAFDGPWGVTVVVRRGSDSVSIPFELATRCAAEIFIEGDPTIYAYPVGEDAVQGYLEPATPGANEIHFTFVDAQGVELPIRTDPEITAARSGGETIEASVERLSEGHFTGRAELDEGRWRFQLETAGEGPGGADLRACFEEAVGAP